MTCPDPKVNVNGCPLGIELSNSVPSSNVPCENRDYDYFQDKN